MPEAPPQLLFVAPLGNEPFSWSRSNLTLWRSPDFGRSWSFAGTVDAGTGGYSSMFLLNGTTVGIVYESHAYGAITLKTVQVGASAVPTV